MTAIQEGDQVVFKRDGFSRVFQIRKNREVFFERSKFKVDDLIGQPYGSTFEVDRRKLVKFEQGKIAQLTETSSVPEADNRNLVDTVSNQKMSRDDIMKMKDDGITGEKIIEELIENSETFRSKTEYSQAKYLKKKKKKHIPMFTVLRPTPRLVLEIFAKEPGKICNLRMDTLSQLLNYGNVMCGSNVAVVETCQGLVLACLLQRMGGEGKLIQLVPNANNSVCRQVMDYFNFPKEHLDNVYMFPLDKLSTISADTMETDSTSESNLNKTVTITTDAAAVATGDSSSDTKTLVNLETSESSDELLMKGSEKSEASEIPTLLELPKKAHSIDDAEVNDDVKMEDTDAVTENAVGDANVKESDAVTDNTVGDANVKESNANTDSAVGDAKVKEGDAVPDSTVGDANMKESDAVTDNAVGNAAAGHKRPLPPNPNRDLQRQLKLQKQKEAGEIIKNKQLDSLILACKYNPMPILMALLEFMPPSRPVVVYCQYLEPLVECYTEVKKRGIGLQLRLSETWYREYQVLPQRTHPMINMSGTGGYLLTFMTVQPGAEKS